MGELTDDQIYSAYSAFETTEFGRLLQGRIRYERYNLSGLDNSEWTGLLGADVNNLTHMPLTYGIARSFVAVSDQLQTDLLSSEDSTMLKMAALIHDQGEAIIGDITFSEKTEEHEGEEKLQFTKHSQAFAPGVGERVKEVIERARDEVVFAPTSRLGRMFNGIERVGYIRTALRAADHIAAETEPAAIPGLRWLVADVIGGQPVSLLNYAPHYRAISAYLQAVSGRVENAFMMIESSDFIHYGDKRREREAAFRESHNEWLAEIGSLAIA